MEDQAPENDKIEKIKQELQIFQERGGSIIPLKSQPPLDSLDKLIAKEDSPDKIRELLALRETILRQQLQQNQIEQINKQQDYELVSQKNKERTINAGSLLAVMIGLGLIYSASPLVGTFILLLGLATLLRIPFDELSNNFLDFFEKLYDKITSNFFFKSDK
ncbi:hypothetical protein IQ278_36200 [Tolypothrix sp. LEGE 11397]|uniref:hypothetical protein n=1 Tax=unclassified Tolypothrix TaxID=2649714 RepID=UPI000B5E7C48|nr:MULTISPECIES: hypothetical protein [unclassified Tolypothrix]MBE9087471.1 hypothetical protein [Tolypothrix sp. LEGE 11397]UYD30785.1 hypothetical protein HGR01_38765 [Tolypothrix sp. PCC 7712]UYD38703.1 hypothetical protein HG267_40195 [Tolypothrix sp. PCC 7601]BAY95772.1 hypothetical protein NIES3275_78490 [Microchaete diplosiphon NIES-3275]